MYFFRINQWQPFLYVLSSGYVLHIHLTSQPTRSEWVNLFAFAKSVIFQLYYKENKLLYSLMNLWWCLSWIFKVLNHWNTSAQVNTSLHSWHIILVWSQCLWSNCLMLEAENTSFKVSGIRTHDLTHLRQHPQVIL